MPKLPHDRMKKYFFERKLSDDDLVKGPEYGEDAAVFKTGEGYEVVHVDPISGAVENIGWLSVNIPANDIAVSGAEPDWALCSLQIPPDLDEESLSSIVDDMYDACGELDISLVGGHTETVQGLEKPLTSTTIGGYTRVPVFTFGSEPGDLVLQVGEAGIEGTWILALDHEQELLERGVDKGIIDEVKTWKSDISVVEDALKLRRWVTSMHDPTEGGVLQGLYECAAASGNDLVIEEEPEVRKPTREICDALELDPLRFISSGCVIATVSEDVESDRYLGGKVIGRVEDGEGDLIYEGERMESIQKDELFRAIEMFE